MCYHSREILLNGNARVNVRHIVSATFSVKISRVVRQTDVTVKPAGIVLSALSLFSISHSCSWDTCNVVLGHERLCLFSRTPSPGAHGDLLSVVKVVMWSRRLAWLSQVWADHIPIPYPTNLALFWHKITLYRFNEGAQIGAGRWAPWPLHFNHCLLQWRSPLIEEFHACWVNSEAHSENRWDSI